MTWIFTLQTSQKSKKSLSTFAKISGLLPVLWVIGNPNPVKLGRCIKELERIYGIQHGATSFQGNQHNEVSPKISESPNQEQLVEMIGISVDTLNNYKKLTELIPELEDLVDTGILAPTTALAFVKYMLPFQKAIGELISGGFNCYFV